MGSPVPAPRDGRAPERADASPDAGPSLGPSKLASQAASSDGSTRSKAASGIATTPKTNDATTARPPEAAPPRARTPRRREHRDDERAERAFQVERDASDAGRRVGDERHGREDLCCRLATAAPIASYRGMNTGRARCSRPRLRPGSPSVPTVCPARAAATAKRHERRERQGDEQDQQHRARVLERRSVKESDERRPDGERECRGPERAGARDAYRTPEARPDPASSPRRPASRPWARSPC